jgi:hypothetical protein
MFGNTRPLYMGSAEYTCVGCGGVDKHKDGEAKGERNVGDVGDLQHAGGWRSPRKSRRIARELEVVIGSASCTKLEHCKEQ